MQKLVHSYKLWYGFLPHLTITTRHTIGPKIDLFFTTTIEKIFIASYTSGPQKLILLKEASTTLDLLQFFLQIAWEVKAIDNKKYIELSLQLQEIGKMLGGWRKQSMER